MSAKEEIYTRHGGGRRADRGKILAEMMNAEGKPEVLDDILVLDVSSANFAGIIARVFWPNLERRSSKLSRPTAIRRVRLHLLVSRSREWAFRSCLKDAINDT